MRLSRGAWAAPILLLAWAPAWASARAAPATATRAANAASAVPAVSVPAGLPQVLGITPFRMDYHVLRDGWHLGNAEFTLERRDGAWEFLSRAHASGLAALFVHSTFSESSRFTVRAGVLHPSGYTYTDSGNPKHDERIVFDWARHEAKDTKGGETKMLPLASGMLDRLTAQLELSRELSAGIDLPATFVVVNGGEIKRYHMKRSGHDEIATPAGNFETVHVVRKDPKSKRVTAFWLAPKYQWLPVKIEQREPGKATVTFVLTKLHWLAETGGK